MAAESRPVAKPARRFRRLWYIAAAALTALAGGYLFLGPLSPQNSGNSWTTFVLHRPVCDGLLARDQVRQFVGTGAWSWEQSEPNNLTNYTCKLGDLTFSVTEFPGPPDRTGGLIGKTEFGSHPQPLGDAGTTTQNLTWVALTCPKANGPDQLMVSLDWGTSEKAVTAFAQFASEVAARRGCQPPDIPAYRLTDQPEPKPLSSAKPVCGLLDPAQLGPLDGWTVTHTPGSSGPVNHCAVSGPVQPNKPPPPSFVISTFSGPFVGSGTQQLDFSTYTSVCRGTDNIYAMKTSELTFQRTFDKTVQAQHNTRCTDG